VKSPETDIRADTPASLRRKAQEFLRLAAAAHDPVAWTELHRLAELYLDRANALETAPSRSDNDNDRASRGERTG
jgi:hypothetical protein